MNWGFSKIRKIFGLTAVQKITVFLTLSGAEDGVIKTPQFIPKYVVKCIYPIS